MKRPSLTPLQIVERCQNENTPWEDVVSGLHELGRHPECIEGVELLLDAGRWSVRDHKTPRDLLQTARRIIARQLIDSCSIVMLTFHSTPDKFPFILKIVEFYADSAEHWEGITLDDMRRVHQFLSSAFPQPPFESRKKALEASPVSVELLGKALVQTKHWALLKEWALIRMIPVLYEKVHRLSHQRDSDCTLLWKEWTKLPLCPGENRDEDKEVVAAVGTLLGAVVMSIKPSTKAYYLQKTKLRIWEKCGELLRAMRGNADACAHAETLLVLLSQFQATSWYFDIEVKDASPERWSGSDMDDDE